MKPDLEAEAAVLACALLNPTAAYRALRRLQPHHFLDDLNRRLFEAVQALAKGGKPINRVALFERVGGSQDAQKRLGDIGATFPIVEDVGAYIELVERAWKKRELRHLFRRGEQELALPESEPDDVAARAVQWMVGQTVQESEQSFADLMRHQRRVGQRWREEPGEFPQLPWIDVARVIRLMGMGQLSLLSGHTGTYKSQFAIQSANFLARNGHRVVYFSLEMSRGEIGRRLCVLDNDGKEVLAPPGHGKHFPEDLFELWLEEREAYPLRIYDDRLTLGEIDITVKNELLRGKPALVVVDYVQNIVTSRRMSQDESLTLVMNTFMKWARRYEMDFLILAQYNRSADRYEQPTMKNLKGSSSLEQVPHQVVLSWVEKSTVDRDPTIINFLVEKNRNGPPHQRFRLAWQHYKNRLVGEAEGNNYDD